MLREMGSTYGRSPGGYIWAFIEPVGALFIMSIAFSLLLRTPSLGTSFLMFYATAFLPLRVYNDIEKKVGSAISYSKPLLAYPRVTWMDAVLARFLLNLLTASLVFILVMSAILFAVQSHSVIRAAPIAIGLVIMILFGLGLGLLNAVLKGLVPVWKQIWRILTAPLILASGLIFILEDLPQGAQNVLWWNPLFHATGLVRMGFYPTYGAHYVSVGYCLTVGLTLVAAGFLLMRAHYKRVLQN